MLMPEMEFIALSLLLIGAAIVVTPIAFMLGVMIVTAIELAIRGIVQSICFLVRSWVNS